MELTKLTIVSQARSLARSIEDFPSSHLDNHHLLNNKAPTVLSKK